MFLLNTSISVASILFYTYCYSMPFRPIKLTKIEFDWNYFILCREIVLELLTYETIKLGKLHVSLSFSETDHGIQFE